MREWGGRVRSVLVDDIPAIRKSSLFHGPDRDYEDRPTVVGELGSKDALALLIVAHADTVQLGCAGRAEDWTVDPFGAEIRDEYMYGLGGGDDKWGIAVMLTIARALQDAGVPPDRRLILASTIDEEHGVANGMNILLNIGIQAGLAKNERHLRKHWSGTSAKHSMKA